MSVKPIPDGFHSVNCYLVVPKAKEALEFYGKAFGAEAGMVMEMPGGGATMHAEMRMGNSMVMLTDANPQWHKKSPADLGGSPVSMHLYVEDTDAAFQRAVEAGCTVGFPPGDMFWGDRFAQVIDPYGHTWSIATHIEDVSPEECTKRAAAWFASMGGDCGGAAQS
ncbi:MAG: VOC family protein [Planctomycetes bacterium]|nr:VOC family protein [Planctomycetota bacterium]MCB9889117.1 VOC family protein [Planctomycetota bacterium]